jgi:hypothetical protein
MSTSETGHLRRFKRAGYFRSTPESRHSLALHKQTRGADFVEEVGE